MQEVCSLSGAWKAARRTGRGSQPRREKPSLNSDGPVSAPLALVSPPSCALTSPVYSSATDTDVVAAVLTSLHTVLRKAPLRTPAGSSGRPPSLVIPTVASTTPTRVLTPLSPSAGPATVEQLLAASTADYLGVSPDAAAVLVADSPEQIQEWLIAGAAPGGPADGAAAWLDALGARSRHVGALLARTPDALPRLLPYYTAGLHSTSGPAATAAAHAAAGLARALRALQADAPYLHAAAHSWFVSPGGPLAMLVPCLATASGRATTTSASSLPTPSATPGAAAATHHLRLDPPLAALLVDRFCRHELRQLFAVHFPAAAPDPVTRCTALAQLLRRLSERGANLRRVFSACGAATAAADDALAFAGASKTAPLRAAALTALSALWSSHSDAVEAAPDTARAILSALKTAARAGAGTSAGGPADALSVTSTASAADTALAVHAHGCMVSLLHSLVECGSPFAPVLLKALIFSSVEHHAVESVRDAALGALRDVVERHPGVPIGALVDPLARRIARLGPCQSDGPLCDALAHHPRLEARHASQLAEALTPTACNASEALRHIAADALVALAAPAAQHPAGAALLGKVARTCVTAFETDVGGLSDPSLPEGVPGVPPMARTTGVSLLMRLAALDSSAVSDALRPCVAAAARAAVGVSLDEPELDLVLDALNGVLRPRTRSRRSTTGMHSHQTGSPAVSGGHAWHEDADEDATLEAATAAAAEVQHGHLSAMGGNVYLDEEDEDDGFGRSRRPSSARRSRVGRPSWQSPSGGHDSNTLHEDAEYDDQQHPLEGTDGTGRGILPPLSGVPPAVKATIVADIEAARRRRDAGVEQARLEYERARLASAHMRTRLAKRRDELLAKGHTPFWDRVLAPGDDGRGNMVSPARGARTTGGSTVPAWTPAGAPAVPVRPGARKGGLKGSATLTGTMTMGATSTRGHRSPAATARQSSGSQPWAQALVLDALNARLAADPETPIPSGFERVVEEEVQEYTETVMDPPEPVYTSPVEPGRSDEVSVLVSALVDELAGPPPKLGPPVPRQVVRTRVITHVRARAITPPPPPSPAPEASASSQGEREREAHFGLTASPSQATPMLVLERSTARVGAGRGTLSDPVIGTDGLYAFERVPARFIAAAVEDMLANLASKIAQEAENAQRDAMLRATRAAKMEHLRGASPERKGGAPDGHSPAVAAEPSLDTAALSHARGVAAVQARLEELKAEERARREKAKASELAERDAARKKAEAARAVAQEIAAAKLSRRAAADAARAQREVEAAAARQAEEAKARKKREEDRARVAAFQAAQKAEAEARQAAVEAAARAEAERKAADLQRVKRELAAKGRGLGQAQPSKLGVAASATKRMAELADEKAADEVLDGLLQEVAPVPTPKSTRYQHVQPRLLKHFEQVQ